MKNLKEKILSELGRIGKIAGVVLPLALASCSKQEPFTGREQAAIREHGYHHVRTLEDGALCGGYGTLTYLLDQDNEIISEGYNRIEVAETDDIGIETGYVGILGDERYLMSSEGDIGRLDFRDFGSLENGARWGRIGTIFYMLDENNKPVSRDERYVNFKEIEGIVCGQAIEEIEEKLNDPFYGEIVTKHREHPWYALNESGKRISNGYDWAKDVKID